MKKLKLIILFLLSVALFNSCLIDNETDLDQNGEGPSLVGFEATSSTIASIADGLEYTFEFKMKIVGPNSMNLTNDITASIGYDASSTAVEGTHFRIEDESITLTKANNYLGIIKVTMLTDGIETPLEEAPILKLKVMDVSGETNVLPNGKTLNVTMSYACPSFLEGEYSVTMIRDGGAPVYWTEYITETGVGEYRTQRVGHWANLGVGTPGFTFYDVCNVITVPGQNLVDYYSNWVEGTMPGSVDPETGIIHIVYSITSSWSSVYDCTYVPVVKK